ncbi:MAG: hypothetical protein JO325_21605 [Solirubrobacterales bacterium]|nr:hypothetical protein [Solirubrobacterales bacterium]
MSYGTLTGGRGHFIYAQHELVRAVADGFAAAGGDIRFGVHVTGVEQSRREAIVSGAAGSEEANSSAATSWIYGFGSLNRCTTDVSSWLATPPT